MKDLFAIDGGLETAFGLELPALRIPEGKRSFVSGPSGSGKSSLLKLLNKSLFPVKGEVKVCDGRLASLPILEYRKAVLLVPQTPFLIEGTILENLEFYAKARREASPGEEVLKEALELAGLPLSPEAKTGPLSGGERQRAFLALFLSFPSEVLLLDEACGALDEACARSLMERLSELGKTLVFVSHREALAEEFADHVIRLEGGPHARPL